MSTSVPASSQVYYKDIYWNDHQIIREFIGRRIGGGMPREQLWWHRHFFEAYLQNKPAKRALILNCGNGWVERELFDLGIIESAVGFDYSPELLGQAESSRGERKLTYFIADCNTVDFEPESFDLIINYAAMHHVQWIDRLQRLVAQALTPDGYFVNFDYVGPHRNQYGEELFSRMQEINALLPAQFCKKPFLHPDLQAMLASDPTEAIHSELIFETFDRYFYSLERKDFNGAIAYQIMHNNYELFMEHIANSNETVQFLLECDELSSEYGQVPPLFSFFIGRPRKSALGAANSAQLTAWTQEELERETLATNAGGRYL